MSTRDLRKWLADAEEGGDVLRVGGAHWDVELGTIVDIFMERIGRPALLFDKIVGYPEGYRVLANVLTSTERVATTLGMPRETGKMDLVRKWKALYSAPRLIPPAQVSGAPVEGNIMRGPAVDLSKFPAPRWHELDGGRFLGTGCLVIMRDPDSDLVNVGCYRVQYHDEKTAGIMITRGRHGDAIMRKYWARGEACPVVVTLGQDPLLLMMAGVQIPVGISEFDFAAGIYGQPVEVVTGELTGLPIPATAEIALEGHIPPDQVHDEGPFGEWTGYYASPGKQQPIIAVERVLHRDNPIILGVIPGLPPNDNSYFVGLLGSGAVWDQVEKAGIPGITGVWEHEVGGGRMWLTLSIKQLFPGHAKQAGMVAAASGMGGYANRVVVVVDEDIDPTNLEAVVWAISTRTDPREDLEVIRRCWSSPLDPMSYPSPLHNFNSRMIIDACRPWERRESFPPVAKAAPHLRAETVRKWPELFAKIGLRQD